MFGSSIRHKHHSIEFPDEFRGHFTHRLQVFKASTTSNTLSMSTITSIRHLARRATLSTARQQQGHPLPNARRFLKSSPRARARTAEALASAEEFSGSRRPTLVGPPDPVSNLRPIIYKDDPLPYDPGPSTSGAAASTSGDTQASSSKSTQIVRTNSSQTHPYSLDEFDGDPSDYQWRLERKRMDVYNHAFWTEVRCPTFP